MRHRMATEACSCSVSGSTCISDLTISPWSCAIAREIAGRPLDRLALLARVTRELDRLEDPAERGAALDEWRRRSTFLGKAVEVRAGERAPLRGVATAIDDDGALLVRTASGTERIVAGEVVLA